MMKLKELESWLQSVEGFDKPKIKLEQYETPAHIAARMLHAAESSFGDISNKIVADLGSGCGMLSIAAALLDASYVVGYEIDQDALNICKSNLLDIEVENVDLVQMDILNLCASNSIQTKMFDTVLLNPPFGTKHNQGIDIAFLKTALELSNDCVLSLHKSSTRDFIQKKAKQWNVDCKILASLRYNLPNTYKFHKKNSIDIEVDFIRFCHK